MAGLDKIISQIAADAKSYESQVMDEAKETAQELLKKGQDQAKALCLEVEERSAVELKNYHERVVSSADFQKRTQLLKAKQEIIAQVIEKAYQTLVNEDADVYFGFVKKMLKRFVLAKSGEIYFSQNDLRRMPQDFEEVIHQVAEENGGTLAFKWEPREMENGFVLVYGGVEENCSLRAVFDARREWLLDKTNELLFNTVD